MYGVVADRDLALFADEIEQGQLMTVAEINEMLARFDFLRETDTLLKILVEHTSDTTYLPAPAVWRRDPDRTAG